MVLSVDSATVDALLRMSRSEHLAYRAAGTDKRQALAALRNASLHRSHAHALDPGHTSPGWSEEQRYTPVGRDTHGELATFYAEQLARRS